MPLVSKTESSKILSIDELQFPYVVQSERTGNIFLILKEGSSFEHLYAVCLWNVEPSYIGTINSNLSKTFLVPYTDPITIQYEPR